jgi:4-amino-4-deoxy-L-arabinose transferase-like glycosyltransferase
VTDPLVANNLKKLVGRERPFLVLEGVRCLVGKGGSGSFPSAHAANWFAAVAVALVYYRHSWKFMLPIASLVAISRVYNGVHYPSDIIAGALIGSAAGFSTVWLINGLWIGLGRFLFPLWWQRLPYLADPDRRADPALQVTPTPALESSQWFRLGCLVIGVTLVARLAYLASGVIELSEDEAYYWLWSDKLALSYYSKPPMVAYTMALGTAIWGDTELGVRFFSPVISALIAFLLLRWMSREWNPRMGVALITVCLATPLLGVGSVIMTIDPLSVLFWTAAMLAGWRAIKPTATLGDWIWVGVWMGFGLYSKYVAFLQLLCWAVVFLLIKEARPQLRRPGPYAAVVVMLLFLVPVAIWNHQHDWITVAHVSEGTSAAERWTPTLRYLNDFLITEFGLLNPVFFVAAWIAGVGILLKKPRDTREVYLLCMGAPLFLFLMAYSLKARINANWIAPSIIPILAMTVAYWVGNWESRPRWVRSLATGGVVFGLGVVALLHNTDYIERAFGKWLPAKIDPLRRVRAWQTTADAVGAARDKLLEEGKPVFIIGYHYGVTSQLSFYMPDSRTALKDGSRLAYPITADRAGNQFYFWPGYTDRTGENAIYVMEFSPNKPDPKPVSPPQRLLNQFESVTDLGMMPVKYEGRTMRWLQLFECRGLQ